MSKIKISYTMNEHQITHHFRPGQNLSDLELKRLVRDLVKVNTYSKSPVENKMLNEKLTLVEMRELYSNSIVCIVHDKYSPVALLISPIVGNDDVKALHIGLIIVTHNFGSDLIFLTGTGNTELAYRNFGKFYVTNIASTPSIIETFSFAYKDAWPSPNINLRSTPKEKMVVLDLIFENYIKKCFPNSSEVQIDKKRFVMSSSSKSMGFDTNMRNLSRASSFKYQSFCHTWIDYDNEEDIIQVATHGYIEHFRNKVYTNYLKVKSYLKSPKLIPDEIKEKLENKINLAEKKRMKERIEFEKKFFSQEQKSNKKVA